MRRVTVLFVVLTASVVFTLLYSFVGRRGPVLDPTADHASFRTNECGTKAFRELLTRCGLQTRSWGGPWTNLDGTVGTLFIIDPGLVPTGAEMAALITWVSDGGTAVIAPDARPRRAGVIANKAVADVITLARIGWGVRTTKAVGTSRPVGTEGHVLLRDVETLAVPATWRLRRGPSMADTRAALKKVAGSEESPTVAPEPVIRLNAAAVSKDALGTFLVVAQHGKGKFVILCDADMLANRWISEADNVILAGNLAFMGREGQVAFDEYHHAREGPATGGLDTRAPVRAIWAGLIALALFFLGRSVRFGPPVPVPAPPRRSSLEYVRAFASLYSRAGQRLAILEMTERRVRQRLTSACGVSPTAPTDVLAQTLARRYPGIDADQVTRVLGTCAEKLRAESQITDGELLTLARGLSRIEQELPAHDI